MKPPFVSVILVSYNSEKDIKECLNSLKEQSYKNFNIFLVDNNSSDNTINIVKQNYPEVGIIENKKNYGFARGNNIGIKQAFKDKNVKYIALLNLDTVVDKNWLIELIRVIDKHNDLGSIQSKILFYDKKNLINTSGNKIHFLGLGYCGDYMEKDKNIAENTITYSSGGSVLFTRKALEDVGLFDDDLFMYHEDLDLGWRLMLSGYKNFLAPNSIVYHKYRFSGNKDKFYFMERNRFICIIKNYNINTLIKISPMLLLFEIGLLGYSIKMGFFMQKIRAYRDTILTLGKTLKKRKIIQGNRKIDDKEIIKIFTSKIEFEEVNNPILNKFANPLLEIYGRLINKLI